MKELICDCGAECWAKDKNPEQPCWSSTNDLNVSEDYPGVYVHFCDAHGHYEDNLKYITRPKELLK